MPELPEVRLITEKIEEEFAGAKLQEVVIYSGRYNRHHPPTGYDKFVQLLPAKITGFRNKGKFIWIAVNTRPISYIWITLGLTGILETKKDIHSHLGFKTSRGWFYFTDMRNFGTVKFIFSEKEMLSKIEKLGVEPWKTLTFATFREQLLKKKNQQKELVTVLMDQTVFAGIGNYLRAEILYDAKVDPFIRVGDLSNAEIERLYRSSLKIVAQSYRIQKAKGLHTYPFQVYLREQTPKGETVVSKRIGERTFWYVPLD